jgi:hypothetical protein
MELHGFQGRGRRERLTNRCSQLLAGTFTKSDRGKIIVASISFRMRSRSVGCGTTP